MEARGGGRERLDATDVLGADRPFASNPGIFEELFERSVLDGGARGHARFLALCVGENVRCAPFHRLAAGEGALGTGSRV